MMTIRVWMIRLALALVATAPAAAQTAPNRLDVVERVTAEDPARFACAHSGRPCEADWIRAVAWALHQTDPAWGLNAKRDGPADDISLDVVTYRVGPTDRHVLAFDVCAACGSAAATPVWSDITNRATLGQPGTARWVLPLPVGGGVTPPPATPPVPPVTSPVTPTNYGPALEVLVAELRGIAQQLNAVASQQAYANERLLAIEDASRSTAAVVANLVADGSWLPQALEELRGIRQAVSNLRVRLW